MYIAKKLLPLSMATALFLFTACGGSGGDALLKNADTPQKVSVPQKISIDIPASLKSNRKPSGGEKISRKDGQTYELLPAVKSYGYEQLQSTIKEAEKTISSVKESLTYLNTIMPDILKECQDTPKNETCTIDAGTISLTVEKETLTFGEVTYTQYDSSKKYQQVVVLDLQPIFESMGEELTKELETIKWSNDENHIETLSDAEFQGSSYAMLLRYDKAEDGSSKMLITDAFADDVYKGNFTLKMDDKNDALHTVNIETSGNSQYGEEGDTFSSKGTVNDNGGFLISKGSFAGDSYAEKETFDTTGKLLQSSFCNTYETCQIDDPSTWIKFDEEGGGIVDDFNDTNFEDTFPEEIEGDFIEPLELTFTNSENFPQYTYCAILPLDYNTSSLNEKDVYPNSIGSFARFDDELFGIFFGSEDATTLNTLPVACNTAENFEFSLISEEIKPTLGFRE